MSEDAVDDGELLTVRLSLRRPERGDVESILAIHSDPRTCRYNPSDALATRDGAERLFERWDDHWRRFGFGYWVVRRRGCDAPVGFCGIKVMRLKGERVANLFYRFDPSSWGCGLASEAAAAVVQWAVSKVADYPVIARIHPQNVASQRVASHAGLIRAQHLDGQGFDGWDWIYTSRRAPPMSAWFAPMAFELDTERLSLRIWEDSDASWSRQLTGERGAGTPTLDDSRRKIVGLRRSAADNGIALLTIRRRIEADFIGYCGLIIGRATLEEPELAYELFRRVHGQGYATEAASAVVGAAIATGRRRLWSTVRAWNVPSFRVLEKIGFERHHSTWDEHGEIVWNVREL